MALAEFQKAKRDRLRSAACALHVEMKRLTTEQDVEHERTWGWYPDHERALAVVLQNRTDIFESGYYNLARIEKVRSGPVGWFCPVEVEWFRADYDDETGETKVDKIECPIRLDQGFSPQT